MKALRLLTLISGLIIIFIFISDFLSSRSPLILFSSSVGFYLVLGVLEREYYYYYNPEWAWIAFVLFQGLVLAYICVFAPIYIFDILFYLEIGFFLYCLIELYFYYKDPSKC